MNGGKTENIAVKQGYDHITAVKISKAEKNMKQVTRTRRQWAERKKQPTGKS